MPLTEEQERTAANAADRFETLDPDTVMEKGEWKEAGPLRAIVAAREDVTRAKEHLAATVAAAHEAGFSWGMIGIMLGVSRQAARQRFASTVESNR
jgi:hypothetical protein